MRIYQQSKTPEALAHLLEAVAEPTRLRIINLLHVQPLCVCDLQNVLGLSEPVVSRHLARLRFAHLVTANRDGNRVVYRLNQADSPARLALAQFLSEICALEPSLQKDLEVFRESSCCARRRQLTTVERN